MHDRIIVAPQYRYDGSSPLIFLAGPIQGAANWQHDAGRYLLDKSTHVRIANPRRDVETRGEEFTEAMYNEQVDWETYHLRAAGRNGAVLFWLANEHVHYCKRAYAQTTRFELAEWKMKHQQDGVALVVGIDTDFTGTRYVRRRFGQDCPDVPLCSTLEETCQAALDLIAARFSE